MALWDLVCVPDLEVHKTSGKHLDVASPLTLQGSVPGTEFPWSTEVRSKTPAGS